MRCTTPPALLRRRLVGFPPAGVLCTSCWGRSLRAVGFLGSLKRSVWSGPRSAQRSGRWSGQRPGHGSVWSGQWSGESLLSVANGGQSLFGLAKCGQSLFGLANTYLWVWSVWPMPVLCMVGLTNTCLWSRTSSWVI